MKVYIVHTSDYYHYSGTLIKGFTNLEKAIEFAVDVVMEKNHKYNRDYVKETIHSRYGKPFSNDLFVYTDYYDIEYDEFVGIITIEVE